MAKILKDCVLFDNYSGYDFEEVKTEYSECNDVPVEEISDSLVWDLISDYEREDWENAFSEIESPYCILCKGMFGTWRGSFEGGKIFYGKSLEEIAGEAGESCSYFKLYTDKKGNLNLKCSHHDGSNYVEFYEVNDRGQKYIDNNCYMSDRELHEHLINSNMTKQIKVYSKY